MKMTCNTAKLLTFILTVLALPCVAQASVIVSSFDVDAEGWSIAAGTGTLSYQGVGGNPGGYLRFIDSVDPAAATMRAFAPGKFLGDISNFEGGSLSLNIVRLKNAGGGSERPEFGMLTLTNNGLEFDGLDNNANGIADEVGEASISIDLVTSNNVTLWTNFSIDLTAETFGFLDGVGRGWAGFQDYLTNVDVISLEIDFSTAPTNVQLDNFRLDDGVNPVPEPATIAVWSLIGLCGVGYCLRRRMKKVA